MWQNRYRTVGPASPPREWVLVNGSHSTLSGTALMQTSGETPARWLGRFRNWKLVWDRSYNTTTEKGPEKQEGIWLLLFWSGDLEHLREAEDYQELRNEQGLWQVLPYSCSSVPNRRETPCLKGERCFKSCTFERCIKSNIWRRKLEVMDNTRRAEKLRLHKNVSAQN